MRDYDRLTPAYVGGPLGLDYLQRDRATWWAESNPVKYGLLALVFWAAMVGVLTSTASC